MANRPNILYVHSHDTGRYVQPYGFAVRTPNFQRLAEEGVLFRQVFTTAPTCSPSRAGLLTGQAPHSSGMLGLAHRGFALHDPSQHLATTLRGAGYATHLVGVQHVTTGDPVELGYRHAVTPPPRTWDTTAPLAVDLIGDLAARREDGPFFLDVGFVETHRPFPEVDVDEGRYLRPPLPLPDTPQMRQDMAAYTRSVRDLDRGLGLILDALDAHGLAESTLVISTTDHGLAFPAMKCNLTDHGTGVLLIMRGPGGFAGGRVIDSLISQVDIYPTICELLGIDAPAWLQGRSFLPVVRGEVAEINDEIFAEVSYHAAYEPQRAIRTARWLLIERVGAREMPVLPNCDDGISRDVWLEAGWDARPIDQQQLYDNVFDPAQSRNLAGDEEYREIRDDLRVRLRDWMARTIDPLLEGPVPLPVGATVNDPASRSFLDDLIVANADGSTSVVPNPRTLR